MFSALLVGPEWQRVYKGDVAVSFTTIIYLSQMNLRCAFISFLFAAIVAKKLFMALLIVILL